MWSSLRTGNEEQSFSVVAICGSLSLCGDNVEQSLPLWVQCGAVSLSVWSVWDSLWVSVAGQWRAISVACGVVALGGGAAFRSFCGNSCSVTVSMGARKKRLGLLEIDRALEQPDVTCLQVAANDGRDWWKSVFIFERILSGFVSNTCYSGVFLLLHLCTVSFSWTLTH